MVGTPGIVKEDNSAADVTIVSDRLSWRKLSGVVPQAVERFDQYWDFSNNRPAVKHRTALGVIGKSNGNFETVEKGKKLSRSFSQLLDQLEVPKGERTRLTKLLNPAQKEAMISQHASVAVPDPNLGGETACTQRTSELARGTSSQDTDSQRVASTQPAAATWCSQPNGGESSSQRQAAVPDRETASDVPDVPVVRRPVRRAQSAGSLGGKHRGRSRYYVPPQPASVISEGDVRILARGHVAGKI